MKYDTELNPGPLFVCVILQDACHQKLAIYEPQGKGSISITLIHFHFHSSDRV